MEPLLITRLLDINRRHADAFCDPGAYLARRRHRGAHPTEICALKCMDGRINLPTAADMPLGIIQPWRNLGGKFDLGWPHFGLMFREWVDDAANRGHMCLVLVTYHFSAGDSGRSCAGFAHDRAAAEAFTASLRAQVERVFGSPAHGVCAIHVGFETDEDALVLHGDDETTWSLASVVDGENDGRSLRERLRVLYPHMPEQVLADFLPLVEGNIRHIADVRNTKRPIEDMVHREWILGVGRGFDWLHVPNAALLVGPFSPNLEEPIATAAHVIASNLSEGRIPASDGFVLLASAPFYEAVGTDRTIAEEKVRFLLQFSEEAIRKYEPRLAPYLHPLAGVVDMSTRRLEVISV